MSALARLAGTSASMQKLRRTLSILAPKPSWLWIIGETGTGKGLVARIIHELSRRPGRFVELNSERLKSGIVESVLFGHARGSFTGADRDWKGRYEQADRGTLFFSEGGRTRRRAQGLLLELLDRRGFSPAGDERVIRPDVRVLFASSVTPLQLLQSGKLEEHFFYRLGAVEVVSSLKFAP